MDTGEFGPLQVKKEVDYNDFDDAFRTDTKVKHEPDEINTFIECGKYDGTEIDFIDKPEYVEPSEVCEDISTKECKTEQLKSENDLGILCENIKSEIDIVEEKLCALDRFCHQVCTNGFSTETGVIDSRNNKFQCSCHKQNDSVNLESEDMALDVKLNSLGLTSDFGLRLIVQDKTRYEDEHSNKPVSTAAAQSGSLTPFKNNKRTASNMSDDFLLSKHQMTEKRKTKFNCKICSISLSSSQRLKRHKRIHTGEKPYKCKKCPKSYLHRHSLKVHDRIHTGENLYKCTTCSKSFTAGNTLKVHEMIHTGEKPFHCQVCSRSFIASSHLKAHLMMHTRHKPFQCKLCSISFVDESYFNTHLKMHTEKKLFQCKICSEEFYWKSHLKVHEENHKEENSSLCKIIPSQ